jgi:NAD(P)-dependent dehydrogenase (short-subunit alcohol dehydrogenase family)
VSSSDGHDDLEGAAEGELDGAEPSQLPVAIVTGAGSGIGRAAAIELARAGYNLVLVGRREQALQETADLTVCEEVLCLPADVGDLAQAAQAVSAAAEAFGRIDALINAAGWAQLHSIEASTPDVLRACFAVNTFGPAELIRCAWPWLLRGQGASTTGGCIVNVSSMATADPLAGFFAYGASKAALESLTRSCAKEGAGTPGRGGRGGRAGRVRAFSVAPGAVETPLLRSIVSEKDLPSALCLEPEFVARVITDCALGKRDEDNGQTIYLPSA